MNESSNSISQVIFPPISPAFKVVSIKSLNFTSSPTERRQHSEDLETTSCGSALMEPFKKLKKLLLGEDKQEKTDAKSMTSNDAGSVLSLKFSEALDFFDILY
jgi:hypothetical protein